MIFDLIRGIIGLAILIGISYWLSANRKAVSFRLVFMGVILQIVIGIFALTVPGFRDLFGWISSFFVHILDFAREGTEFVFGHWPSRVQVYDGATGKLVDIGTIFAIRVLPTIIFFSALSSGLYYLGILQKIVQGIAWVMQKTMRLSGPESLAAAANIFIGQTEAPLLIRPYLPYMTKSELMCLMTGGMATIAGGVLAAYIDFLGGDDPYWRHFYATHLLTASIMSAPAAIVVAKILIPETEKDSYQDEIQLVDPKKQATNLLDALTIGTTEGLKLSVNVGAMLIAFIALIAMLNAGFLFLGEWLNLNQTIQDNTNHLFSGLTLEYIAGFLFKPIAFIMGTDWNEALAVGSLLGQKTIINEFVGYASMSKLPQDALSLKSKIIATYALCGFSNFSSIAIQIGGIGTLIPERRHILSQLGLLSMIGGTIACLMTATIAGMLSPYIVSP